MSCFFPRIAAQLNAKMGPQITIGGDTDCKACVGLYYGADRNNVYIQLWYQLRIKIKGTWYKPWYVWRAYVIPLV
jgi:hypothetical protein